MQEQAKSEYLQIRISPLVKKRIQKEADKTKMGMSEWILLKLFPPAVWQFRELIQNLGRSSKKSLVYAEINHFLKYLSSPELEQICSQAPTLTYLSPLEQNYLAAMVEVSCSLKGVRMPSWTGEIKPLPTPYWGSSLESLRLYLLVHSPVPFKKRNIFIDSTIGDSI